MATKVKKHSDWAVVLVIVFLLVVSNLYWLLVTNELEDQLDQQAQAILILDQRK